MCFVGLFSLILNFFFYNILCTFIKLFVICFMCLVDCQVYYFNVQVFFSVIPILGCEIKLSFCCHSCRTLKFAICIYVYKSSFSVQGEKKKGQEKG